MDRFVRTTEYRGRRIRPVERAQDRSERGHCQCSRVASECFIVGRGMRGGTLLSSKYVHLGVFLFPFLSKDLVLFEANLTKGDADFDLSNGDHFDVLMLALNRAAKSVSSLTLVSIDEVLKSFYGLTLKSLQINLSVASESRFMDYDDFRDDITLDEWFTKSPTSLRHLTLVRGVVCLVVTVVQGRSTFSINFCQCRAFKSLHLKRVTTRPRALSYSPWCGIKPPRNP